MISCWIWINSADSSYVMIVHVKQTLNIWTVCTTVIMPKKKNWSCFRKSARWKNFYHSPACINRCVAECLIFYKRNKKTRTQKAKETKEEKRVSMENLTGYDDVICGFALCTFNLLDRVVSFSWLFIWIECSLCATRKITVFVIQQH